MHDILDELEFQSDCGPLAVTSAALESLKSPLIYNGYQVSDRCPLGYLFVCMKDSFGNIVSNQTAGGIGIIRETVLLLGRNMSLQFSGGQCHCNCQMDL